MKTFQDFIVEATTIRKLKMRAAILASGKNKNSEVYKNLLKRIREREKQHNYPDYPGRESARKDKRLIPSHRTSSFPDVENISTETKNEKKRRKQRAPREIN